MNCCNNEVKELLTRDMCCEHEEHIEFSVESPKEGQILVYSAKVRAFINVDPSTIKFG